MRTAGTVAILVAAYFVAGKLGLTFARVHGSVSPVWPPSGIALAALILLGLRWWPAILLGSLLVNLTTTGSAASSLGISIGNSLEAVVGAVLTRRFAGGVNAFDRPGSVFTFTVLAGMVSTAIAATVGVSSLMLDGLARGNGFGRLWLNWWVGDFAGVVVFAPLLILWGMNPRVAWSRAHAVEAALLGVVVVAVSYGIGTVTGQSFGLKFLCLPPLLWVAFRFTPRESATAMAIVALLVPLATTRTPGIGPGPTESSLEMLQLFLCVAGVTALAVATMVSELRRIEASVRKAHAEVGMLHERQRGDLSRAVAELALQAGARRRAERFSEAIVDTVQEPLVVLDDGFSVRAVNAAFCAMFRTSRDAAENRPFFAIGGQEWDTPSIRALLREALRDEHPEPREIEMEDPSTGPRTMVVHALRLALEETPAPLLLMTMRDVTESRRAMQELRASEERYRAVVETAVDGIMTSDRRGRIVSLNRAAQRIFDYTDAESVGLPVSRLIRGRLRDPAEPGWEPLSPGGRTRSGGAPFERTGVRKDGSEFPLEIAVTSWRSGTELYITAIVRDITERKAAERHLRELSGRLLQIRDDEQRRIARELHDGTGQKIWAMSLNLAHLKRAAESLGPRPRAALAELVELANECAREIRDIASLLHPPLLAGVGVASAIRSHVDSFVRRTGIQVSLVLPTELGPLPPDVETAIFRIVQECLTNIQRHAASPTATVRIESRHDEVRVEVSDEGRGMPKEYGKSTSGVGIHAMSGRVRQLDGQLEIDSAAGRGTKVRVMIPLPADRPRSDAAVSAEES